VFGVCFILSILGILIQTFSSFRLHPSSFTSLPLRRFVKRKDDEPLAGHGADVGMQALDLAAGDAFDEGFEDGAPVFNKFDAHLLDELAGLGVALRLDEPVFGAGEHALEPDDNHIVDDVRFGLQRPAAHVFFFRTASPLR